MDETCPHIAPSDSPYVPHVPHAWITLSLCALPELPLTWPSITCCLEKPAEGKAVWRTRRAATAGSSLEAKAARSASCGRRSFDRSIDLSCIDCKISEMDHDHLHQGKIVFISVHPSLSSPLLGSGTH